MWDPEGTWPGSRTCSKGLGETCQVPVGFIDILFLFCCGGMDIGDLVDGDSAAGLRS